MSKKKKVKKKSIPSKSFPLESENLKNKSKRHLFQSLFIALLAIVIYANTVNHDFTQDDAIVITENMYTTQGVNGIYGLLRYDTFKGFFKVEGKDQLVSGGRYRPLTPILFALEWQIFKKKKLNEDGTFAKNLDGDFIYEGNSTLYHITNILFYAFCCLMVLWTLRELLFRMKAKQRDLISFCTALLFTVHPLHTEAVANIKGADEVVTLLLSMSALLLCLQGFRLQKFGKIIIAAIVLFFALMAKENAITFLGVIPLAIYFLYPKKWKENLIQLLPLLIAGIAFIILRSSIIGFSLGEESKELLNNPYLKVEGNKYVPFSFGERYGTILFTLGKYIQLFLIPNVLTHDYYPRAIEIMDFTNWKVIVSLLVYVGMIWYGIKSLVRRDWIGFGILFFMMTISIVSNVIFPVGTNMSERFMFMPSVGLCLVVALLLNRYLKKEKIIYGVVGMLVLLFSFQTVQRNKAWKDNFTLFMTDIENSPNSAKLLNAVGAELSQRSQYLEGQAKVDQLNKAIGYLKRALEIHPNFENAYLQLGNCYTFQGQPLDALPYYKKVLSLDPSDKDGIHNMGVALRDAKNFEQSVAEFKKLYSLGYPKLEVDYKIAYVYEEAGKYYSGIGDQDKAIAYFKQGIALSTEKDKLTYFLGVAYALKKELGKAIETMNEALRITKDENNKINIYRALVGMHQEAGNTAEVQRYNALISKAGG